MDGELVGAVTVEGVGLGVPVWGWRLFVEQVAVGQGGSLELGVGLAKAEALHGFARASVRAGAIRDLGLLLYPPVRKGRIVTDDSDKLGSGPSRSSSAQLPA